MNENQVPTIPPKNNRALNNVRAVDLCEPVTKRPASKLVELGTAGTRSMKTEKVLDYMRQSEKQMMRLRKMYEQRKASRTQPLAARNHLITTSSTISRPAEMPSALEALSLFCEQHALNRKEPPCHKYRDLQGAGRTVRHDSVDNETLGPAMEHGVFDQEPIELPVVASKSHYDQPAYPLPPLDQVNDAQLSRYARLIYDKTGIRVSPQKKMLLSNRLRRRLRQTKITDFDAYYRYLKDLRSEHPEWDLFFQEITTHETYLFRDENQWDWFSHVYLKDFVSESKARGKSHCLRIWSAACSTGDEVYTIASCAAAHLPSPMERQINILGTDLATGEIQQAKQAMFTQRAMRLVPEEYLRFFDKDQTTECWYPKPILRQMVRFQPHNLMARLDERPFDIVFLKNVLIYFDKDSKKKALDNVCPMVRPGGLLVAGAAEGVASLIPNFKRLEPWLFQRIK